jgi:hypothetical protein
MAPRVQVRISGPLTQVVAKGLGTVAVVQAQHVANHVKHH